MSPRGDELLVEILSRARALGFLGPGPVEAHIRHAEGFAAAAERALGAPPERFVDLGSGGGVPGLVLGVRWVGAAGTLVESNRRRCAALRDALADLDLGSRVAVVEDRAETAARMSELREQAPLVTARSFAEPPVTAEIAAGFVSPGGVLVVSEPPAAGPRRWPVEALAELGFGPAEEVGHAEAHFVVIRKIGPTPERFPRPVGRPAKRPLW